MATIGSLMGLATFIDQGESLEYYTSKFPEESPVWGIFTLKWIVYLGFDHMWISPVFLGLNVLLEIPLMAYTYTNQIPLVKIARSSSEQEFSKAVTRASIQDLGGILMGNGYEVFLKGTSLYAFRGLAGRYAPIGVHLAMLLIMGGATLSAGEL